MKANQMWREFFTHNRAEFVASLLNMKRPSVYKWNHPDGGKAAGGWNPAEVLDIVMEGTKDLLPLHWLCARRGGIYVPHRVVKSFSPDDLFHVRLRMGLLHTEFVRAVNKTVLHPNFPEVQIVSVRRPWDDYTALGEYFVRNWDGGNYRRASGNPVHQLAA